MLSLGVVSAIDANSTDDVQASDVDEEPPSGLTNDLSTNEILADSNQDYDLSSKDISMYYKGKTNYEVVLSKNIRIPVSKKYKQ